MKLTIKKDLRFILNLVATLCGVIALICYLLSGTDASGMTETTISALVYVPIILAIVVNLVVVLYPHYLLKILAFSFYFFALASWALTQAGFIVNVFMGIDGNVFSFAYILSLITMLGGMIGSILSAVLKA